MPPRNTASQLARIRSFCREYGFMEISGVDINQPRQSFNCPELRRPEFAHLNASTWAMVAHEALASLDPSLGLFSPDNSYAKLSLESRIALYAKAGLDIGRQGVAAGGAGAGDAAMRAAEALMKGDYQP
jgi:hypothetical protein